MTDTKTLIASLPADARGPIEAWVAQLRRETRGVPAATLDEVVEEIVAHVADVLLADVEARRVETVLEQFGTPAEYAEALKEAIGEGRELRLPVTGRVLGVPYELRIPTASRVRSRWWDTSNPRILVPRVFGVGWTVNFGGLAVRLGLLREDDGDEPFEAVPERLMWLALAVPTVLAVAFLAIVLMKHGSAPDIVPSHWGPDGSVDGWASKEVALGISSGLFMVPPYLWAVWGYMTRDTRFNRIVICAFASSIEVIGVVIYAMSIFELERVNPFALAGGVLAPVFLVPFAMLVGYARVGMGQEMDRG